MAKRKRKSASDTLTTEQLRAWAEAGELTGRIGFTTILSGRIHVNQLTQLCEELCAALRDAKRLYRRAVRAPMPWEGLE